MAHDTKLLLVGHGGYSLPSIATVLADNWNSSIAQNGDYTMTVDVGTKTVQIQSGQDREDALNEAKNKIYSKYNLSGYDSVLYLANASMEGPGGYAPGKAGNSPPPVAIIDNSINQASLRIHEVGHLYDGHHSQSRKWGSVEYTAMGNPNGNGCDANEYPSWYARKPKFSPDCNIGTPNGPNIRSYMNSNL